MVAVIQVAMIVAMTRNNVKLDLSLVAKETDIYELTKFLEFASLQMRCFLHGFSVEL